MTTAAAACRSLTSDAENPPPLRQRSSQAQQPYLSQSTSVATSVTPYASIHCPHSVETDRSPPVSPASTATDRSASIRSTQRETREV